MIPVTAEPFLSLEYVAVGDFHMASSAAKILHASTIIMQRIVTWR